MNWPNDFYEESYPQYPKRKSNMDEMYPPQKRFNNVPNSHNQNQNGPELRGPNDVRCEICDVICCSKMNLRQHELGKKHKIQVAISKGEMVRPETPAERSEKIINAMGESKQFIHSVGMSSLGCSQFICEICEKRFKESDIFLHVQGKTHQDSLAYHLHTATQNNLSETVIQPSNSSHKSSTTDNPRKGAESYIAQQKSIMVEKLKDSLDEREKIVEIREQKVSARETECQKKSEEVSKKEMEILTKEKMMFTCSQSLTKREAELKIREKKVSSGSEAFSKKETLLQFREKQIKSCFEAIAKKETELRNREKQMSSGSESFSKKEMDLKAREDKLSISLEAISNREAAIISKEETIMARLEDNAQKEAKLDKKEKKMASNLEAILKKESELKSKEKKIMSCLEDISMREAQLQTKEIKVSSKSEAIFRRETELKLKKNNMQSSSNNATSVTTNNLLIEKLSELVETGGGEILNKLSHSEQQYYSELITQKREVEGAYDDIIKNRFLTSEEEDAKRNLKVALVDIEKTIANLLKNKNVKVSKPPLTTNHSYSPRKPSADAKRTGHIEEPTVMKFPDTRKVLSKEDLKKEMEEKLLLAMKGGTLGKLAKVISQNPAVKAILEQVEKNHGLVDVDKTPVRNKDDRKRKPDNTPSHEAIIAEQRRREALNEEFLIQEKALLEMQQRPSHEEYGYDGYETLYREELYLAQYFGSAPGTSHNNQMHMQHGAMSMPLSSDPGNGKRPHPSYPPHNY